MSGAVEILEAALQTAFDHAESGTSHETTADMYDDAVKRALRALRGPEPDWSEAVVEAASQTLSALNTVPYVDLPVQLKVAKRSLERVFAIQEDTQ